jgi:hypothetical protein
MDRISIATSAFSFVTAAVSLLLQISQPSVAQPPVADLFSLAAYEDDQPAQLEPRSARSWRGHGDLCNDLEAKLAAGLAFAKVKLAITREQEAVWGDFAAAVSSGVDPLRHDCAARTRQPKPTNLPESFARSEARLTAASAVVRAVRPAANTLYGQFTAVQRDRVDELLQHLP